MPLTSLVCIQYNLSLRCKILGRADCHSPLTPELCIGTHENTSGKTEKTVFFSFNQSILRPTSEPVMSTRLFFSILPAEKKKKRKTLQQTSVYSIFIPFPRWVTPSRLSDKNHISRLQNVLTCQRTKFSLIILRTESLLQTSLFNCWHGNSLTS